MEAQNMIRSVSNVFDENALRAALKAKPVATITKRPVLGDIGNQNKVQQLKQNDTGKIQKKVIKTNPRPILKPKVRSKDEEEMDMDEVDLDKYLEPIQPLITAEAPVEEKPINYVQLVTQEEEDHKANLARLGIVDIDLEDADDPLAVSEYVTPIFKYLLVMEDKFHPLPNYMSNQADLAWKMRNVLVNWLVEVHWKYKLLAETLFLSVNIMDRFLGMKQVARNQIQLVGVASLLIASKFEEIYTPSVQDFIFVCNSCYTTEELLHMERVILCTLGFQLGCPCALTFLRRISKAEQYDIPSRTVSKYLIEMTVLDEKFLNFKPSLIAAAATWLSRKMLKKGDWDKSLEFYSGYDERALEPCVNEMLSFLQTNERYKTVYKKYSSTKFLRASLFVEQKIAAWLRGEEGPTPDIE